MCSSACSGDLQILIPDRIFKPECQIHRIKFGLSQTPIEILIIFDPEQCQVNRRPVKFIFEVPAAKKGGLAHQITNRSSSRSNTWFFFFSPSFTFLPARLTRVRLHTAVEDTLSFSFCSSSSPPPLSPFFPCRPPNSERALLECWSLRSGPCQQYTFWKLCQQYILLTQFKKTACARAVTRKKGHFFFFHDSKEGKDDAEKARWKEVFAAPSPYWINYF